MTVYCVQTKAKKKRKDHKGNRIDFACVPGASGHGNRRDEVGWGVMEGEIMG